MARLKVSKLWALSIIGIAPSSLSSFSDTFSTFKVSFYDRATPIHSPPSGPKSLSLIERDSMVLLRIRSAAMHTAPYMPREFFRIELSTTPRSICLSVVLLIKSSKNSSSPSPLIMLEARLTDVSLLLLRIFFTACMP